MTADQAETQSSGTDLLADVKRMLPIWGMVVATAVIVVLSLRYAGVMHLKQAAYAQPNACDFARVHVAAALQRMDGIRESAATLRYEQISGDPTALDRSALGILEQDKVATEAREKLMEALQLCPIDPDAHYKLSLLEWYLGNAGDAYRHLGDYHRLAEDLSSALLSYRMALEEAPEDVQVISGLALTLSQTGQAQEATGLVRQHEGALKLTAEGQLVLGRILLRSGNAAEAEAYLKQGLQSRPADRLAVLDLVQLLRDKTDSRAGAEFLMTFAGENRETVPEAYHAAAGLFRRVGNLEGEEEALRRTLKLAPRNADVHFQLAVNLYRQGKYSEARDQVNTAAQHNLDAVLRGVNRTGIDPRTPPE